MKPISIIKAEYVGDLSVKIVFNDNTSNTIDVGTFIKQHPHPQ